MKRELKVTNGFRLMDCIYRVRHILVSAPGGHSRSSINGQHYDHGTEYVGGKLVLPALKKKTPAHKRLGSSMDDENPSNRYT